MQKRKAGVMLVVLGAVLLLAALLLLLYNEEENRVAGESAEAGLSAVQEAIAEVQSRVTPEPTAILEPGATEVPGTPTPEPTAIPDMPEVRVDGELYIGYLSLPEIEIELPVMSDWTYEKLRTAPCRQYGSLYTDDFVIAAHNYERHFGKLKNLSMGSECTFTDMAGNVVEFKLEKRELIDPFDEASTELVVDSGYDLVLYTCTIGGANRVVCFYNRVSE